MEGVEGEVGKFVRMGVEMKGGGWVDGLDG